MHTLVTWHVQWVSQLFCILHDCNDIYDTQIHKSMIILIIIISNSSYTTIVLMCVREKDKGL